MRVSAVGEFIDEAHVPEHVHWVSACGIEVRSDISTRDLTEHQCHLFNFPPPFNTYIIPHDAVFYHIDGITKGRFVSCILKTQNISRRDDITISETCMQAQVNGADTIRFAPLTENIKKPFLPDLINLDDSLSDPFQSKENDSELKNRAEDDENEHTERDNDSEDECHSDEGGDNEEDSEEDEVDEHDDESEEDENIGDDEVYTQEEGGDGVQIEGKTNCNANATVTRLHRR